MKYISVILPSVQQLASKQSIIPIIPRSTKSGAFIFRKNCRFSEMPKTSLLVYITFFLSLIFVNKSI